MKDIIKNAFLEKTSNTLLQLVRYTFVGGFAFLIDFGLLFALTEYLGLHYLISATLSFIAGLLVNYALSKLWVFSHSKYSDREKEFLLFASIGVVGLLINNVCLWLLSSVIGIWYMLSKIITTIVTYLWNFFARKYIIF